MKSWSIIGTIAGSKSRIQGDSETSQIFMLGCIQLIMYSGGENKHRCHSLNRTYSDHFCCIPSPSSCQYLLFGNKGLLAKIICLQKSVISAKVISEHFLGPVQSYCYRGFPLSEALTLVLPYRFARLRAYKYLPISLVRSKAFFRYAHFLSPKLGRKKMK